MGKIIIGEIVNVQGIKGELRVYPLTDNRERFLKLDTVYVEKNGHEKNYLVESARLHKQFVLLKLENIDDRTTAETYKKSFVTILEKDMVPLEADEYYMKDMFDILVSTDEGEEIGKLLDIYTTSKHDVYVIEDKKSKTGELLIPATKECIKKIDIANKKMIISIMDGLRDIENEA